MLVVSCGTIREEMMRRFMNAKVNPVSGVLLLFPIFFFVAIGCSQVIDGSDPQTETKETTPQNFDINQGSSGYELIEILGRGEPTDIDVSPYSNSVAIASTTGVWILNPEDSTVARILKGRILFGQVNEFISIAWSQTGSRLAAGGVDGHVSILNMKKMELISNFDAEVSTVHTIAWSPDGTRIVAGGASGMVTIWDLENLSEHINLKGFREDVWSVAWSPDGKYIAAGGDDGDIKIWSATTGYEVVTFRGHFVVAKVSWSPNGMFFASTGHDGIVRVRTATTWEPLYEFSETYEDWYYDLQWSPNSNFVVAASYSKGIQVYDVAVGELRYQFKTASMLLDWSSISPFIIAVDVDGGFHLINSDTWEESYTLVAPTRNVVDVSWPSNGENIIAINSDGSIRMWDSENWQEIALLPQALLGTNCLTVANCITVSPDATIVASAFGETVVISNTLSGTQVFSNMQTGSYMKALDFSSNGDFLASGDSEGDITIWEVHGETITDNFQFPNLLIENLEWSPNDEMLAVTSYGSIYVLNIRSKEAIPLVSGDDIIYFQPKWSIDGKYLAAVTSDDRLIVWDSKSGELVVELTATVNRGLGGFPMAWLPDGKLMFGNTPSILDPESGISEPWIHQGGNTTFIAWSSAREQIAIGTGEGNVEIWALP